MAPEGLFRRRLIGAAGAAAAALPLSVSVSVSLLATACSKGGPAPTQAPAVGYTLLDGRRAELAELRSRVVLVNFWATSCTTCVAEMPAIVDTWQRYHARGFETLAVAMKWDPPAAVARFAETRRLPFGVAIDNTGAMAQAFGDVKATPTTFLIDRRGAVKAHYVGAPDFAQLHRLIDELLAAPA